MDVAGIITAVGGVVALIIKVSTAAPRKRKAEDIQDRLDQLEAGLAAAQSDLLQWAGWAHDARMTSAAQGFRLPTIPAGLLADVPTTIPAPRGVSAGG